MPPRFNDDFYCRTIEEWENQVVPQRALSDYLTWSFRLAPVALVLGTVLAGRNWQMWLAILAVLYLFVSLFVFIEELNENVRFVRHQMRVFRDAVRRANATVGKYKDPERNFTLHDALSSIDREWEDPAPSP